MSDGIRNATAFVMICGLLSGMSCSALAFGQDYWLFGDKKIQIAGLGLYHTKKNPGTLTCAAYVGSPDEFKAGNQAMVDLADQAFEEFIGTVCADNGAAQATLFVGDRILLLMGQPAVGSGGMQQGRSLVEEALDSETTPGKTRVDYASSVPRIYERISQPEIRVKSSLREPNLVATPNQIAPGITVGLENTFELNPDNGPKPYAVVLYETDVPIKDAVASKALAQRVLEKILGDRLKSGALRGASAGAYNQPKQGRFHFREAYRYAQQAH